MKIELNFPDELLSDAQRFYQGNEPAEAARLFTAGVLERLAIEKENGKGNSSLTFISGDFNYELRDIPSEMMAQFRKNATLFYPELPEDKAWVQYLVDSMSSITNVDLGTLQMSGIPIQYLADFQSACREIGYDEYSLLNSLLVWNEQGTLQLVRMLRDEDKKEDIYPTKETGAYLIICDRKAMSLLDQSGEAINKALAATGHPHFGMNGGGLLALILSEVMKGGLKLSTSETTKEAKRIILDYQVNAKRKSSDPAAKAGRVFTK